MSWVDIAIFPFIRQFSIVDINAFEEFPLPSVRRWLSQHLQSELFHSVMQKHPVWRD